MKEKNKKDITPVFVLTALSVVLAILTIFSFVMMKETVNERIATEKAYYQIQAEAMFYEVMSEVFEDLLEEEKSINAELREYNKDLKKQIDLLQSAITSSEVPTNTSIHTEKEDYIECLVSYFNEQEEMEFMIYLYNNYPEIFYDILSFYEVKV